MADIKISALNQLNITELSDVVAIVDDSASETKKITTENLLGGDGHTINLTYSENNLLVAGSGNTINGTSGGPIKSSTILGGINNTLGGSSIDTTAQGLAIVGGIGNQIEGSSYSEGAVIIGGKSNTIGNGGGFTSVIIGNESSNMNGGRAAMIGGWNNTMNGGNEAFFGAAVGSTIAGGQQTAIIASNGCTIQSNPIRDVIIGTESSSISSSRFAHILGGYGANINTGSNFQSLINSNAGISGTGERNMILNSTGANINNGTFNSHLSSNEINIGSGSNYITTINVNMSSTETITNTSGSTFISCWDTITGNDIFDNTLHTDNIHTYKVESFEEVNAGSVAGSVDVDCSQGTFFLFTITGDTTPNFINVRNGQRFMFIVYNDGSWAVPTATLNGASNKVYAKNGTISPTNNGYSKYFATYDGINDLLFLDEEKGFSAV